MPFIDHCSRKDIINGDNLLHGDNCILIQIADICGTWPNPVHHFNQIHQFEFMDEWEVSDKVPEEALIGDDQAQEIVRILRYALHHNMNVQVHCIGGVSRSFAVSEVAVQMGFARLPKYGCPNLLVKHKLQKYAGLSANENEQPYMVYQSEEDL